MFFFMTLETSSVLWNSFFMERPVCSSRDRRVADEQILIYAITSFLLSYRSFMVAVELHNLNTVTYIVLFFGIFTFFIHVEDNIDSNT